MYDKANLVYQVKLVMLILELLNEVGASSNKGWVFTFNQNLTFEQH